MRVSHDAITTGQRAPQDGIPVRMTQSSAVDDAMTTLIATGMRRWDAMLELISSGMAAPCDFLILDGVAEIAIRSLRQADFAIVREICRNHAMCVGDPNGLINAYLEGSGRPCPLVHGEAWLKTLPKGLAFQGFCFNVLDSGLERLPDGVVEFGGINLKGCGKMRSLPDRLRVMGYLVAPAGLVSMPSDLLVDEYLDLRESPAWDGVIPNDARLGGYGFAGNGHFHREGRGAPPPFEDPGIRVHQRSAAAT
jgi:hypothetical protein